MNGVWLKVCVSVRMMLFVRSERCQWGFNPFHHNGSTATGTRTVPTRTRPRACHARRNMTLGCAVLLVLPCVIFDKYALVLFWVVDLIVSPLSLALSSLAHVLFLSFSFCLSLFLSVSPYLGFFSLSGVLPAIPLETLYSQRRFSRFLNSPHATKLTTYSEGA